MRPQTVLYHLRRAPIIGIVRAGSPEQAHTQASTLLEGGLEVVEISLTTPGAVEVIATLVREHGEHVAIGAGTVCTAEDARAVVDAGAKLLVSPSFHHEVVALAAQEDVASFPGCLTPTEMLAAMAAGATAVKIFPAHLWSPTALRGLLEALPRLTCVPTGGVTPDTAVDWIAAGALAVGMGAGLARDPAAVPPLVKRLVDGRRQ